jgi:hypothetical protein
MEDSVFDFDDDSDAFEPVAVSPAAARFRDLRLCNGNDNLRIYY